MTPSVVVTRGAPSDAELVAVLMVIALLRQETPSAGRAGSAAAAWGHDDRVVYRPPGMWGSG